MRQQSGSAIEIVAGLLLRDTLKVGQSCCRIAQLERAGAPAIERIERIRACSDRAIERSTRRGNAAVVHIKIAKLLVIACGRIDSHQSFKLPNPLAAREYLHRSAQ